MIFYALSLGCHWWDPTMCSNATILLTYYQALTQSNFRKIFGLKCVTKITTFSHWNCTVKYLNLANISVLAFLIFQRMCLKSEVLMVVTPAAQNHIKKHYEMHYSDYIGSSFISSCLPLVNVQYTYSSCKLSCWSTPRHYYYKKHHQPIYITSPYVIAVDIWLLFKEQFHSTLCTILPLPPLPSTEKSFDILLCSLNWKPDNWNELYFLS